MSQWPGFVAGVVVTLILATFAGWRAWRRFVVLDRRTRRAERLAELGRLTSGLAHEIKNPLSTVQLNLQLLQEDLPGETVVGARVYNRLRTLRQEASRLRAILDDFLRYAGRIEVERQSIDLRTMIEELTDFFGPQAQSTGVRLRVNAPAAPVEASVDPRLLKQAMLNLMLNATQAMPQGGELMIDLRRDGSKVVVEVTDTGPGIPAEVLPNIFDAYFTTKKGGTGLGLPMTRRIVEEHNGQIAVESEPGKGTRFRLMLPA